MMHHGSAQPNMQNVPVQPISSLTPYLGNKWWVKARITDKGDIKTWNKPSSSGKLFSFTIVDESASMRATMFNDTVDQFHSVLVNGAVYYLCGGSVKPANKKFNNVNNEYEVTFDKDCQINACRENTNHIPTLRYNFFPISALPHKEVGCMVDVLGVVVEIGEVSTIIPRQGPNAGQQLLKRTVKILDTSASIELTVWSEAAQKFNIPRGSAVAFRNLKIGQFDGGVTVTSTPQSNFDVNPGIPDVKKLVQWYTATGGADTENVSTRKSADEEKDFNFRGRKFFSDILSEGLGKGEKADFMDVRCTPVFIKTDNLFYDACPTCNKKITALNPNANPPSYRCEKCNKTIANPEVRYLCTLQCSDNVSHQWISLFNDSAESFWKMSARELKSKMNADSQFISNQATQRLMVPMLIRCKVREEKYDGGGGGGGEDRVKLVATRIAQVSNAAEVVVVRQDPKFTASFVQENQALLKAIQVFHS